MLRSIPSAHHQSIPPKVPNILLVEDEPFVREATRDILENAGFRVHAAGDAVEAMHMFEDCDRSIDLVMTDMVLPGRSGLELAGEIHNRAPQVRVLVTSGYINADCESEDGPEKTYFLAKPYSRRELLGKIGAIFDRAVHCAASHAS